MEEKIIQEIKDTILDEQRKHPNLDWQMLAARKIYQGYVRVLVADIQIEKKKVELNYNEINRLIGLCINNDALVISNDIIAKLDSELKELKNKLKK
jgi:hypothetical protein